MVDERAQHVHLLMQVRPPDVAYPLALGAFCAVLSANGILLQLGAMGKPHTRFVAVQSSAAACSSQGSSSSQACTTDTTAQGCI